MTVAEIKKYAEEMIALAEADGKQDHGRRGGIISMVISVCGTPTKS